jgi:SAM-dependent methyltransferase
MNNPDDFTRFEHSGWERVAHKYNDVWATLTTQFIAPLLRAANVKNGMSVLDVACGPGYVAAAVQQLGALAVGIDFSREMILRAREFHPGIEFREGDAQALQSADETFDRVLMNFGLFHLSSPDKALAEARRVLRHGGTLGFTLWAKPEESPYSKLMNDAIEAHADMSVELPSGPPYYLFTDRTECRNALQSAGFAGDSMTFETFSVNWKVPTADFPFEAELHAGVRSAALLARQSPERLALIRSAVEKSVERYAVGEGYAIPIAAYIVVVSKK